MSSHRHPSIARGTYPAMGAALAKARGERTGAEIARVAGVDPSSLCAYEAGRALPSDVSLQRLAKALGADLKELRELAQADARRAIAKGLRRGGRRASARPFAKPLAPAQPPAREQEQPPKAAARPELVERIRQAAARRAQP